MKIAIVGGGMAGLTAYMSLKKHLPQSTTHDIKIYERHNTEASQNNSSAAKLHSNEDAVDRLVIGGGLGLAPNGMRALEYLSPGAHARITAAGFAVTSYEMRTSANGVLGSFPAGTERPTEQKAVMTSWRVLWEELRREVPAHGVFEPGRKVIGVESGGIIVLEDGERVQADLVIGADGAKSVCRGAVLEEEEDGDAEFQGLVAFGGFASTKSLPAVPPSSSEVVMTFGPKAFFGYTPCSTAPMSDPDRLTPGDTTMWWSTFSSATPQAPLPDSVECRKKLQDLHGDWSNPIIRHIIEKGSAGLATATWTVPKLPRWSKGRVVLVGDAAHALPSTSGQGVSQAFEDVVTLGVLLGAAINASGADQIDQTTLTEVMRRYTNLRKPRVEEIRDEAIKMQGKKREMNFWELWIMYGFMWVALKLGATGAAAKVNGSDARAVAEAEVRAWRGIG